MVSFFIFLSGYYEAKNRDNQGFDENSLVIVSEAEQSPLPTPPRYYLFPPATLLMYKGGFAPFKTPKTVGRGNLQVKEFTH
jgi:hypothetical protein